MFLKHTHLQTILAHQNALKLTYCNREFQKKFRTPGSPTFRGGMREGCKRGKWERREERERRGGGKGRKGEKAEEGSEG